MKITIDEENCLGCGMCASICDECFEMAGNVAKVKKTDSCTACDVKEVAQNCPAQVIKIEE